nr:hypothetical protein [Micromonospora sp. DSM 115978]
MADTESTFVLSDSLFSTITSPLQRAQDIGAPKVTFVVIDVPAALNLLENVARAAFEEAGIGYELDAIAPGTADKTPQMQTIASGDTGVVFIIGNDAFCISAMNGL